RFTGGVGSAPLERLLAELHDKSMALYRAPGAVAGAAAWHLLGWLLRTGETWLALRLLGAGIGPSEAPVIRSLSGIVRSAAFMIPGGLGAQEGAIVVVGGELGLPPEIAVALALVKRVEDLAVYGPGLVAWWYGAGRQPADQRVAIVVGSMRQD